MTKLSTAKARAIDRLAEMKSELEDLQLKYDALEEKLRKVPGVFETDTHRLSVFDVQGKKFNWTRAKKLLGAKYATLWVVNTFRSSKLAEI